MPKIAKLDLNANKITDFRVEIKGSSCNSLQHLDLGGNLLDFSDPEFTSFMDKLKKFKNLKSLILLNNPFAKGENKQQRFDQILKFLKGLEWFNYEKPDE